MLEIVYSDDSIVVINKPAGMLSIPGRAPEMHDSASSRIQEMFSGCIKQPSVHRLDMDTSGLMVFALKKDIHRNLSIQFQNGDVKKKYTAVLEGLLDACLGSCGRIELKFRLDVNNRPYQIFDPINGKNGITIWKKLETYTNRTRVEFSLLTGRTHQLRLHSAHPADCSDNINLGGLGCPIAGDRLYGRSSDEKHSEGERMLLHASELEFRHPATNKMMSFSSDAPF